MKARLREIIQKWAEEHGLCDDPAYIHGNEILELATLIEGVVLDYYAKTLKGPE